MSDSDRLIRNLSEPQPLDIEAESQRLMMTVGIVQSLTVGPARAGGMTDEEVWAVLWRRVPFIKALGELGRAHPEELRALWKKALQEPMPFGGAPLGLPEGEEP